MDTTISTIDDKREQIRQSYNERWCMLIRLRSRWGLMQPGWHRTSPSSTRWTDNECLNAKEPKFYQTGQYLQYACKTNDYQCCGCGAALVCVFLREVFLDMHICVPGIITVSVMRSGTLLLSSRLSIPVYFKRSKLLKARIQERRHEDMLHFRKYENTALKKINASTLQPTNSQPMNHTGVHASSRKHATQRRIH